MVPSSLLSPLGLHATIEETRRVQGAHGVVDLIVATMTNRRLRRDADIDEHLTHLKAACRQTRRYREALPVLQRVAALRPNRRHEMAVEIALAHWHLGEPSVAIATLEAAVAQQRGLPAAKRSLAFALLGEVAATVVGRSDLATACTQLGRSTATPAPRRSAATPRRAPAAATRTATKAVSAKAPAVAGSASAGPSVGRRRAKGPVRQLSVLGAAHQPTLAATDTEPRGTASTRPRLTLIGGAAA